MAKIDKGSRSIPKGKQGGMVSAKSPTGAGRGSSQVGGRSPTGGRVK